MRRSLVPVLPLLVACAGAAACASTGGGASANSLVSAAAAGKIGPAMLEWSGKFRATQQQSATFGGLQGRNRASGTVVLTAESESVTRVRMSISLSMTDAERMGWSLAPGACGSNSIPLKAVAEFPEVTASNGHASLDDVVSIPMPVSGTYHINVFNPGTTGKDEADVFTCADLTLQRRSN